MSTNYPLLVIRLDGAELFLQAQQVQLISLDRLPDTYADGIAKQMFGDAAPQFFEWCPIRDLERISQALTYQQTRTGAPTK